MRECRRAISAILVSVAIIVCFIAPLSGADWPQWRGPSRNGISSETLNWPKTGPKRAWSARIGEGYSSVAVKGGRVYTMGSDGRRDTIFCLDERTGKPIWKHSYDSPSDYDYSGPRSTPTVDGNFIYTISRHAQAFCLNATTGKLVWGKDLGRLLGLQAPRWGFAGSPLVEGRLVIYNVGTNGTALDKASGALAWKTGSASSGYASPIAFTVGGQRGVAIFAGFGLIGLNPTNGRSLWRFAWPTQFEVNAADPIFSGTNVFISSNYNQGCALLNVSGGRPSVVWQNRNMRNHFNSSVLVKGHIFGNDQNTLKCLDMRNGQERWLQRGMGRGGLIAAGNNLIVLTERGTLVIVKAVPDRYTEVASAQVMRGSCWTHPVLSNGRLYCRSHEGELVCLNVGA